MVYFFNYYQFNRLLLSGVLVTFSMAIIAPPPAYSQIDIGFNDIFFVVRMEKLVEKLWKYQEREDYNKLLDTMLDMKLEVEGYTGQKINIDKELDKIEIEIKKKGGKIPKKGMEKIRKIINKRYKKEQHRAMCVASYLQDQPDIGFDEYKILYKTAHGHDKEKDEENEILELPGSFVAGVTMMLAGGFLCIIGLRIPVCMEMGKQLAYTGLGFCVNGYIDHQDENKEKDKNKNK